MTFLDFKKNKKTLSFIGSVILVIVLLIAGWYFWQNYKKPAGSNLPKFDPKSVIVQMADEGKILTEVPAGLVVDKNAKILGSAENVSQDPNSKIFVTSYVTEFSVNEIKKGYSDFAKNNNYSVPGDSQSGGENIDGGAIGMTFIAKDFSNFFIVTFSKDENQKNLVTVISTSIKK
jgi:hypothetical protein